jgi:hypothetical protein
MMDGGNTEKLANARFIQAVRDPISLVVLAARLSITFDQV